MSFRHRVAHLSALLIGCALLPTSSFAQLTFQPSQPAQISSGHTVTMHGDFNNDGREDLIVTGYSNSSMSMSNIAQLYLSTGDGTYATPITLPALVEAIGDFNGDGKLDFASMNSSNAALSVYLGNGDGTFQTAKITAAPGEDFSSLIAVDLNHDSKTDLVGYYAGGGVSSDPALLQLYISNGDGTFSKGQSIVAGTGALASQSANGAVTGDFDGDGRPDIALIYGTTYDSATAKFLTLPTTVQVFYGDGAGHLGSPSLTADLNKYSDNVAIAADVTNDGRSDIVSAASRITNGGNGGQFLPVLSVFAGNSNRTLSYSTTVTNQCAGILGEGITVADFNGDGRNDIAYQESPCNQSSDVTSLAIKQGEGGGKFGAEEVVYQNLYQTGAPFAVAPRWAPDPISSSRNISEHQQAQSNW